MMINGMSLRLQETIVEHPLEFVEAVHVVVRQCGSLIVRQPTVCVV